MTVFVPSPGDSFFMKHADSNNIDGAVFVPSLGDSFLIEDKVMIFTSQLKRFRPLIRGFFSITICADCLI